MNKPYKYDVAISFAEEDKAIAEQIALSLKKVNLVPYFYEFESAENWGENIFNVIINRYREQARFALILISQYYVRKKWASIELQIIQAVSQREGKNYLIPLRIDHTPVPELSSNTLFEMWNNDADQIAAMLKQKVDILRSDKTEAGETKLPDAGTKIITNNMGDVQNLSQYY